MNLFITLLLIIISATPNMGNTRCTNDYPKHVPKYHIIEKCHRSKLGIAAKANYSSLTSCQRLGIEKKALALNFSPPDATTEGDEPLEYTCEVLKCAEADGGLSLTNDTRYDYYSVYARPIPNVNSTCVPATGMFYLLPTKHNFTHAVRECKNISAVLADITSEQRTDALAQLLAGASVDAAMVGLRRKNESSFRTLNGEALDCTTYRAWAPGHPRRNAAKFDCALITRQRTWQSVACKSKHPVLCELVPGGPYKRGSIFASRRQQDNETYRDADEDSEKENDKYIIKRTTFQN